MDWKEEFWKLFLSDKNEDINSAYSLKQKHIPHKLYRYRSISSYDALERVLSEIKTGNIFLAHPATFNDPFDCSSVLSSTTASDYMNKTEYKEEYSKFIPSDKCDDIFEDKNWLKKLSDYTATLQPQVTYEKMNQLLLPDLKSANNDISKIIRSAIRVACFSETDNNVPMWYHYANSFSGLCIEYDKSNFSLSSSNSLFPVNYKDNFIDVVKEFHNKTLPNDIALYMLVATHKHIDWNYEKEWRIIVPNLVLKCDEKSLGCLHSFNKPSRIILGCKIHPIAEKNVLKCCEENGIECVKNSVTEFGLTINTILKTPH